MSSAASSAAPDEPAAGAVAVAARPRLNPGWGLVILGGLLGVLGAFLTWAKVDYGGLASHTYRGVSAGRDGKITVVLSVLVLGVTAAAFLGWVRGWMRAVLVVLGLVIAFIAIADLAASPSVGGEEKARLQTPADITSSNGFGEWLTLVAGILVVIGVVLVARYSRPASATVASPLTPGSQAESAGEVSEVSSVPEQSAESIAPAGPDSETSAPAGGEPAAAQAGVDPAAFAENPREVDL
jgi:drug/metabolite transporter (DMT)-like permease